MNHAFRHRRSLAVRRVAIATLVCLVCAVFRDDLSAKDPPSSAGAWPRVIPCRIHDGANPDVFVTTLGPVETPLAQGTFDPVRDLVRLNDGSVRSNYYRDTLEVPFYQPLDKSRFVLPPSGWCSWYYYYNHPNSAEIERNADWIAANLKDFGARIVQIDDGWQGSGGRDGGRDWTTVNSERFPNGMAELAAHIKSLGLTPGLWLAPHGQSNPAFVTNHAGLFLHRQDGQLDASQQRWEGRYLIDPSTPESLDYFRSLFSGLAKWGYEYFKIDGQPTVSEEYRNKKSLLKHPSGNTDELYRGTLNAMRDAIGPDRYLLGCWGIPLEGAGILNGSRTGGDVVLGWGGFHVALRPTMQYYYLHNIVWYCDPDVLLVRSPLTLDQARVWATVYGLTGQALMASDRLMDLGDDRVELLRRVYPATDIRPLDLFPTERNKRIWDLKVHHLGRHYDVVGVFNFDGGKAEPIRLVWSDLGIPSDKPVHVFDFWNHEYLGAWMESTVVETAPTSCRVLALLPDNGQIQLVSTSRHITQGWLDLVRLEQNAASGSFSGTSQVVKNDPYELRFAFPRGTNYVVKRAIARAGSRRLPATIFNHQGWAAIRVTSPKTQEITWEVQFASSDVYHFPQSDPAGAFVEPAGLDGVNLHWREQYYLNAGYQVYLDGALLGHTPMAQYPIRGLSPLSNYVAEVKTVWEDGRESPRGARASFSPASMAPEELPLTQLEPLRATGRWRGFEIDEMLSGAPLKAGGKQYDHGLSAFVNSEIEFDLKGLYESFSCRAALDDSSSEAAAAEFTVIGDGKPLWHSGALGKTNEVQAVDISIRGVQRLILKTESPGQRRNRSQADWIEPKVSRGRKAAAGE